MRQVPLATPFGRLARERGGTRGVILSAALHVAVVLLLVWSGSRLLTDERAPGPGHGRGGGGGGGNRTLVLYVAPAPAPPAPAPPAPALVMPKQVTMVVPAVPVDTTPKAPAPAPAPVQPSQGQGPGEGAGTGPGKGPGSGSGSGGGNGSGVGPGAGPDSGGGGTMYPPSPQGIILPPSHPPSALRGTRLTAVFEISAFGRGDARRARSGAEGPLLRQRFPGSVAPLHLHARPYPGRPARGRVVPDHLHVVIRGGR